MVTISKDATRRIYHSLITFDSIVDLISRIKDQEEKFKTANIEFELDNGMRYQFKSASEAVSSSELSDLRNKRVISFYLSFLPELSITISNNGYSRLRYESGDSKAVALVQLIEDCLNVNFDRPLLVRAIDHNFITVFTIVIPMFLIFKQLEHIPKLLYPMLGSIIILNLAFPFLIIKYERGTKILMENNRDNFWHQHKGSILVSIVVGAVFFCAGIFMSPR